MATPVVVSGASGRMGQTVVRLAREAGDFDVIGGIDREASTSAHNLPRIDTIDRAADLIRRADVVIDFSASEATTQLLRDRAARPARQGDRHRHDRAGAGYRGRTRHTRQGDRGAPLRQLQHRREPDARAGRSGGACARRRAFRCRDRRGAPPAQGGCAKRHRARARPRHCEGARHTARSREKRRAHPGKAARGRPAKSASTRCAAARSPAITKSRSSARASNFAIAHHAADRAIFAEGAIRAARWIAGKPAGRYTMKDVLGISSKTGDMDYQEIRDLIANAKKQHPSPRTCDTTATLEVPPSDDLKVFPTGADTTILIGEWEAVSPVIEKRGRPCATTTSRTIAATRPFRCSISSRSKRASSRAP